MSLRKKLIRLAHSRPDLRPKILPLLKTAGGEFFEDWVPNTNVQKAFEEAVEEARYEYGNRGYTGTISEKDGYKIRSRTPMNEQAAREFIKKDGDKNDKWGPAFAIPYTESKPVGGVKEVTIKVKARDKWAAINEADRVLRERLKLKDDESVSVQTVGAIEVAKGGLAPLLKRTQPQTTVWRMGHMTLESPTKKGIIQMAKDQAAKVNGTTILIQKVVTTDVLEFGPPTKLPTWEVVLKYTKSRTGKQVGWVFYGWASS